MATCVIVPMGPACANLTGIRGGDLNVLTATITSKGNPLNLTGLTLSAQARKKVTDLTPAITAVITVDDAAAGKITIRWPGSQVTTALDGKATWAGVWDLQAKGATGDPTTLVAGAFSAEMDVTRP